MSNLDLKKLAKEKGVYLWQIASEIGITDANFSRRLRKEFSDEEKEKIRKIIEDLSRSTLSV